jgi:hypothetical protein
VKAKITKVIDTNVILVANAQHGKASEECVIACVQLLKEFERSGVLAIDDSGLILSEYLNKTKPWKDKGAGDVFVKWAHQQMGSPQISVVSIHEHKGFFDEFPDKVLQTSFDAADRKFVAVAAAHESHPPILQATDSKWLDWWPALKDCGVQVEFLCKQDIAAFYTSKFPEKTVPEFPA